MSGTLGIGIIGFGMMGRTHASAYVTAQRAGASCVLRAIATRRPDETPRHTQPDDALSFTPETVRWYDHADALLADDGIHAVSICTWTDTHVALALRALAAGKHVLVEKPLALTAAAIRPLVEAARAADRLCMPAMCMRFWPGWPWLRERIRDGVFGALLEIRLTRLVEQPGWAPFYTDTTRSGGALFDLHIHDVDMLVWCFGAPASVEASGDEMHVRAHYAFPGLSLRAVAEGGWMQEPGYPFTMRYEAVFQRAIARFDFGRVRVLTLTRNGETEPIALPDVSAYDAQVKHFIDCIAAGRREARATLDDAIIATSVLELERRSLQARAQ